MLELLAKYKGLSTHTSQYPEPDWCLYSSKINLFLDKKALEFLLKADIFLYKYLFLMWKFIRQKNLSCWPFFWRHCFVSIVTKYGKSNQNNALKLLDLLGPAPDNVDNYKNLKYKLPVSMILSFYADKNIFEWGKLNNINFNCEDKDGFKLISYAIAYNNFNAILWALDNNFTLCGEGPDGLSLCIGLMLKSNPDDDIFWQILEKEPKSLYFKDRFGYSAIDFINKDPVWLVAFSKRDLNKSIAEILNNKINDKKKRKM